MNVSNNPYNTPEFRKAFAGYTLVLAIGLMGASWIRAENLPAQDGVSFIGTVPAAASEEGEAPTF